MTAAINMSLAPSPSMWSVIAAVPAVPGEPLTGSDADVPIFGSDGGDEISGSD